MEGDEGRPCRVQEAVAPWAPHRGKCCSREREGTVVYGSDSYLPGIPCGPKCSSNCGPAALERGGASSLGPRGWEAHLVRTDSWARVTLPGTEPRSYAVWSSQDAPVLEIGGRGPVASRPEGHTVRQHALRPRSGPHTSLSAILANAQHLTRLPEAGLYSGAPRARWAQGSKLCSGDAGGPALL